MREPVDPSLPLPEVQEGEATVGPGQAELKLQGDPVVQLRQVHHLLEVQSDLNLKWFRREEF